MGLLNWYFSDERKAKNALYSDEQMNTIWNDFLGSFPKKKTAVRNATANDPSTLSLLKNELMDIEEDEAWQKEMVSDILSISHEKRMRRVSRIEECLNYNRSQMEYAHHLVCELGRILQAEFNIVEGLLAHPNPSDLNELKNLVNAEEQLISKINGVGNFHHFFKRLCNSEQNFRKLTKRKGLLYQRMHKVMDAVFDENVNRNKGFLFAWIDGVYTSLGDAITESQMIGEIGGHPFSDYEFVNGMGFLKLAEQQYAHLKGKKPSDKLLWMFCNHFREWFNHNREEIGGNESDDMGVKLAA